RSPRAVAGRLHAAGGAERDGQRLDRGLPHARRLPHRASLRGARDLRPRRRRRLVRLGPHLRAARGGRRRPGARPRSGARGARDGDVTRLPTGADLRLTGDGTTAVVCVNGGQAQEVAGTWSASLEWLVQRLAPRFPQLAFAEVRYRVKSWRRLDACIEDARAAI